MPTDGADQLIGGNQPLSPCVGLARVADQQSLGAVACDFAGLTASPCPESGLEPLTIPPCRVEPSQVDRYLGRAAERLAHLVRGHKQPFAVALAGIVEGKLFRIRLIPRQDASAPFPGQFL